MPRLWGRQGHEERGGASSDSAPSLPAAAPADPAEGIAQRVFEFQTDLRNLESSGRRPARGAKSSCSFPIRQVTITIYLPGPSHTLNDAVFGRVQVDE